jgi:hypothetical protein
MYAGALQRKNKRSKQQAVVQRIALYLWLHPRWYSHTMRQWTKLHTRKGRLFYFNCQEKQRAYYHNFYYCQYI